MTEKVYETESCTDSEEEGKTKVAPVHRPPAAAVKKETKEEPRKGPKKGTAALGKANRQVSILASSRRSKCCPWQDLGWSREKTSKYRLSLTV